MTQAGKYITAVITPLNVVMAAAVRVVIIGWEFGFTAPSEGYLNVTLIKWNELAQLRFISSHSSI